MLPFCVSWLLPLNLWWRNHGTSQSTVLFPTYLFGVLLMTSLFQLFAAVLIGLVLAIYGLLHATHGYPDPGTWSRMAAAMPTLGAVSFFVLGVAIAITGLLLAVFSGRRLRRRWQHHVATATMRRNPTARPSNLHYGPREQEEPEYYEDANRPEYSHDRNGSSNGQAWAGSYRG